MVVISISSSVATRENCWVSHLCQCLAPSRHNSYNYYGVLGRRERECVGRERERERERGGGGEREGGTGEE